MALLAERGFTAGLSALKARPGYLTVFCKNPNIDALIGQRGERFELQRNTYKPYPCGIVIHPVIDVCLEPRRRHRPDPDRIVSVAVQASPGALALCDNRFPMDEMRALFGLHHWTAVAFTRGTARLQGMNTGTAVKDPALMSFQSKVEATADPSLTGDQAEVTITMSDGTKHTCRIEHGIGSRHNPMTNPGLEREFTGLTGPLPNWARTNEPIQKIWAIGSPRGAGNLAKAAA